MSLLIDLLSSTFFSGVPSNMTTILIQTVWKKITHKTWEDLYLDAFQAALNEAKPYLQKYTKEGDIALDREVLLRILHQNLAIAVDTRSYSQLSESTFIDKLAATMEAQSILVIGGHELSQADYSQLIQNLVRHARNFFKESILNNELAFRQALLEETLSNQELIRQIPGYLVNQFGLPVLEKLDNVARDVHDIKHIMPSLGHFMTPKEYLARPLFTAPVPLQPIIERPSEFEAVRKHLLDTTHEDPESITISFLQGSGGFGKTTLALALCYDRDIRSTFSDGVLWIVVGEEPRLIELLNNQILFITGEQSGCTEVNLAATDLMDTLLAERKVLLVLDDVWNELHIQPFLQGAPNCARLITTRNQMIPKRIKAKAVKAKAVDVDKMTSDQAVHLLVSWLDDVPGDLQPLKKLAHQLGGWPLLLQLAGPVLRQRVEQGNTVEDACEYLNQALQEEGVVAFDNPAPEGRNQAIEISMNVSMKLLKNDEHQRYLQLAIFPGDTAMPLSIIEAIWRIGAWQTERLCERLNNLSLLKFDLRAHTISMHEMIHDYLERRLDDPALLHATLVDAWGEPYKLSDEYAWHWYAYHLKEAGRIEAIRQLLFDFNWLQAKIDATDVNALLLDFDLLPEDAELQLVKDAIRLSASVLSADKTQLASQLLGRLLSYDMPYTPGIQTLLLGARQYEWTIWFHPLTANLNSPGGPLVRLFYGHNRSVRALAVSRDEKRLISASSDNTLKLWDLETGYLKHIFQKSAFQKSVRALAVSRDEKQLISASADNTLKLGDLETGYLIYTFRGHASDVWAVAMTADGKRAVSASDDKTLKVWDLEDRSLAYTFSEHKHWVHAVAMDDDGKIVVSGSEAGELKVWRLNDGKVVHTLEGHTKSALTYINGVAVTADGKRAVSASRDATLKVWDIERGGLLHTLKGHENSVLAVAVTADGQRAISASRDATLKVWDIERGELLHTLRGHTNTVRGVAVTPDGERAVSGSSDTTLKVWDIEHGKLLQTIAADNGPITAAVAVFDKGRKVILGSETNPTLQEWDLERAARKPTPSGQKSPILALAVTTAGLVISASQDKALKVWDLHEGKELYTLRSIHEKTWAYALAEVSDRCIVSASWDKTLKMWDLQSGQILHTLKGHRSAVKAVAVTADKRWIVSGSRDTTLKVWNAENGQEEFTLPGHKASIDVVAVTPDGRAVSGSSDRTLIVWDLEKREMLRILEGHVAAVNAVAVTPDGRAVSASYDETLIVWNLENGQQLQILKGHTGVVHAVEVTPDGKYAVSAADDNTLKLWNLDNGCCLATFTGEGAFSACTIAQDGITVLAGEKSGRIHFLRLENL